MKFRDLFRYFLHLLWPVSCPVCGRPGVLICKECLNSIFPENISTFKLENLTLKSISIYDDEVHEILSSLTDEELRRVYMVSGFKISENFSCPENIDFIIPVPLYYKSTKNFNKAQEIAKALSRFWGIKVFDSTEYSQQQGFIVPEKVNGFRVILVNDICITGSTLLKFSQACRVSGAEVVCAYVCAFANITQHVMKQEKTSVLLPPYFELVPVINTLEKLEIYSAALYQTQEIQSIKDKIELGRQMAEFFGEPEADYIIPVSSKAQEIAEGMSKQWGRNIITPSQNIYNLKIALVDEICINGRELRKLYSECVRAGAIVVRAYALAYFEFSTVIHKLKKLTVNIIETDYAYDLNFFIDVFGETEAEYLAAVNSNSLELAKAMCKLLNIELLVNMNNIAGLKVALVCSSPVSMKEIRGIALKYEEAGAFVICVYVLTDSKTARMLHEDAISEKLNAEPLKRIIGGLEVYSASKYNGAIKELIWDFKFRGKKNLCEPTGRAMAKFFVKPEADCIIPVPLHLNSTREYNQAYEIAKGLSEIWSIKILDCAEWAREMPKRIGLNAQERMQITYEDFRITQNISGLRAVLIDDVCTTGSTLRALASACERAGAKIICAYTLAYTS